jgi:hypothetical protein
MSKAYHFTKGDLLRDGQEVPSVGVPLVHTGKVVICESGLHASFHVYDALKYAPGNTLHLVDCEDIVTEQYDKFVCRKRTVLKTLDAYALLREYAREQALKVVHLWDAPEVVLQWLTTGEEKYRVEANSAAYSAAYPAARSAAYAAVSTTASLAAHSSTYNFNTYSAAHSAANFTINSIASYTARYSVSCIAYSTAHSAAHSAARQDLQTKVDLAFGCVVQ